MKIEFLKFASVQEIYENFISKIKSIDQTHTVETTASLGFVCAEEILAKEDLPGFNKSLVDGYAVKASDTKGASANLPVILKNAFEVRIGEKPERPLQSGEAAWVPTGGALPAGADAVVMVEHTQNFGEFVEIAKPVGVWENVMKHDEDIKRNEVVLTANTRVRIGHIQLLLQLGITKINVYRRAKIAVISTGDEIVEPWQNCSFAQVRDSNTYTLVTWLKALGFSADRVGHVEDDEESLYSVMKGCIDDYDIIVIAGGSSIGTRDYTARAIERLGNSGIIYHGVMVQPGKPTIFALAGTTPIIGLPGNPVSFYVSSRFFLLPTLRKLENEREFMPKPIGMVRITKNVPSVQGREHFVRVKLRYEKDEVLADPLFSETAHVSNIAAADGVVRIPAHVEGVYAGQIVELFSL
ncbi:MAG: gephyrin-like molybdotransferase Glp [Pseudothermotoga sp.]